MSKMDNAGCILKQLPVDESKIDESFVIDMKLDSNDAVSGRPGIRVRVVPPMTPALLLGRCRQFSWQKTGPVSLTADAAPGFCCYKYRLPVRSDVS